MDKRSVVLAAVLLILAVLFTGCQPETIEVVKTVEVMVEGTPVVKEIVVTATPAPQEAVEEAPTEEVAPPAEIGHGDVFRAAVLSDMTSMNIWSTYGPINSSIWNYAVSTTYNPVPYLVSYHRWDYVPVVAADMASTLEQEGDYWVSTVPFRSGITWSDGTPLTAADWAWTAEVALTLGLQGNWADFNPDFLDHIEAIDDTTAKVYYHTKPGLAVHQYGVLLKPMVSKAFWEPMVAPLLERFRNETEGLEVGSDDYLAVQQAVVQELEILDPTGEPSAGAWSFSQWEEGAFVENVRNEGYFNTMSTVTEYEGGGYKLAQDGQEFASGDTNAPVELEYTEGPWFDKVLFSIYSSDAAVLALDAGEVDFIITPNGLSRGQAEQLANSPNVSTAQNAANGFRYLAFNFRVPALKDVVLRQAIACMIDKPFLTQDLLQGAAIPVNTIIPESNAYWYNPDVPLFCEGMSTQERLEEAVRMLRDAGYTWDQEPYWLETDRGGSVEWGSGLKMPDGSVMPELRLLAPTAGYDPLRATAGVYIEQWMNQLGIPVTAQLMNFNRILEIKNDPAGDWDMFILGWGVGVIPDYACYFLQPGQGWNVGLYDSEVFDAKCNEFFAETDQEKARDIGFELQDILATDLPYIYLFTTPMWDAWDNTTVAFPFTDVIDGIGSGTYGLQEYVMSVQ